MSGPVLQNNIVGIFDSGVGGLSVWRELIKVLPGNKMVYVSDNAYSPYGPRPQSEIVSRAVEISEFLIRNGAGIIVIACNTATAAAIDELRWRFDIPFVGMEPAVKPAAQSSKSKVIGVLATKGTFMGRLYNSTLRRFATGVRVVEKVGTGLVDVVESGRADTKEGRELLEKYIRPMIKKGADHIVLGCTHYPFLSEQISQIAGEGVTLVDPAPAVAKHTLEIMEKGGLVLKERINQLEQTRFFSTGSVENLKRVARTILPSLDEGFFEHMD